MAYSRIRLTSALCIGVATLVIAPEILSAASNYTSVACGSQAFFSANSCDLCYEEKTLITPGAQLVGLYDTWINTNPTPQLVYEDEQAIKPTMIPIAGSGTQWTSSIADPIKMWEFTSGITWTNTGTTTQRRVAVVASGIQTRFIQQRSGTSISLTSTDKRKGEYIGMMKFPLAYHDVDPVTGTEGPKILHYECVTYRYDAPDVQVAPIIVSSAPVVPIVAPVAVAVTPKPAPVATPAQMTKTKTGPETTIMLIIAALVSLGAIALIRKRV